LSTEKSKAVGRTLEDKVFEKVFLSFIELLPYDISELIESIYVAAVQ